MGKIQNTRFGEIEYKDDEVIYFNNGIPAFETEHQFIIVDNEEKSPFAFLQSITTKDLALAITDPFTFYHDYEFELDEQTKEKLEIDDVKNVVVWNILSIPEEFQKATINLKAPIIINIVNNKGKQVILKEDFPIKAPLFKGGK